MRPSVLTIPLLGALLASPPAGARLEGPGPRTPAGVKVLERMHRRYAGKWFTRVAALREARFEDGRREWWAERMEAPDHRRLDVLPVGASVSLVFRGDSIYERSGAGPARAIHRPHPLRILSFDVYHDAPSRTATRLAVTGIRLDLVHEEEWRGRPAIVVGADLGDRNRSQFWIDRERLVLVRVVEVVPAPVGAGEAPARVRETWLEDYGRLGAGWVARRLQHFHNGERFLLERVDSIALRSALEPGAFAPAGAVLPPPWAPPGPAPAP